MTNFSERYKGYRITELLVILQNPNDYVPEALKAARRELDRRYVSENDFQIAQEKVRNYKQNEKKDLYEKIDGFLGVFKPIKDESKRSSILVNRACLLLLALFFYYIKTGQLYFYVLFKGIQKISVFDFISFAELILLPIVAFVLFKRKTFALAFAKMFCVSKLAYVLINKILYVDFVLANDEYSLEIESFYYDIGFFVFYSLILWLLFRPTIKGLFISKS